MNGIDLPDSPNSYDHIIFAIQAATDDVQLVVERSGIQKPKPKDTGYFEPADMASKSDLDHSAKTSGNLGGSRALDGVMDSDGIIAPPLSFVCKQKWYGRTSIPKPFTINWEDGRPVFDVFYANGGEAFELRIAGEDAVVGQMNVADDGCSCLATTRTFSFTYAQQDSVSASIMHNGTLQLKKAPWASTISITTDDGGFNIVTPHPYGGKPEKNKLAGLLSQGFTFEHSDGSRVLTCNRPAAGSGIGDTYRVVVSSLMNPQLAALIMLSFDKIRSDEKPVDKEL